jgi:uncharacterized protein YbaR (Trm112 family)
MDESMSKEFGFPREFLSIIRCPIDSGQLSLINETSGSDGEIVDGSIGCEVCPRQYPIENGIVRLMKEHLTQENEHEMELKDQEYEAMPAIFVPPTTSWRSEFMDRIEIAPHLAGLEPLNGRRVLELGCGDGRFTMLMAQMGANILAVDISIEGLRVLRRNYLSGAAPTTYKLARSRSDALGRVGLVQADASALHLAPTSFDRALSATPLDSRDERMKMYNAIAVALNEDGRYVAGVEYDDLCRRVLGLPKLRRYSPGGILIEHLDMPSMRREISPYFGRVRMRPIRVSLPLVRRLRLPTAVHAAIARTCTALPGLRHIGTILLVIAERPIWLTVEGERRRDFLGARSLYRRYKRWRGEEATWDRDQPV